jgi:hypothetical protein
VKESEPVIAPGGPWDRVKVAWVVKYLKSVSRPLYTFNLY